MVNDQEEEDVVQSQKKSDVFRVWVKLKIPKAEEEETEEEGKKMTSNIIGDDEKTKNNKIDMKRVCGICEKVFSSGKALGGHMRIHVQQPPPPPPNFKRETHKDFVFNKEKKKLIKTEEEDKVVFDLVLEKKKHDHHKETKTKINGGSSGNTVKYSCRSCAKEFPSMKSLSGHMRCHPERDWRGIHPPPKHASPSSSSSSPLSDVENDDASDHTNTALDLTQSLRSGWSVTARRGRTATRSEDDHQLLEAVNYLMMLAQCKPQINIPETNPMIMNQSSAAIAHGESINKSDGHEWSDDDAHMGKRKNMGRQLMINESSNVNKVMMKNKRKRKRKRKKMKLCDLGGSCDNKYSCNSCEKSFSTHQALGGHRSSNNTCNREKNGAEGPSDESHVMCTRVLEFDLNDVPPSEGDQANQL